uniref:type II secretion system protein n=1 Tax=Candidatus Scatousia sp. TaxID=3085663 RepID=UPI004025EEFB
IVLRGGGRLSFLSGQGFTDVSHPELVSGSKETEVVETDKDRFRTKFGMTKTTRHPELVSGSKGTEVGEIVQNRFRNKFGMTMSPLPLGEGGRSPGEGICISRKFGFTLAEVLITLGIIGVVAALTLPTLNQAVNKRVRAEQIRTVKYKFTKATDKMNSLGLIGPYNSTAAFVAELQKHLKIAKVCPSSKLRECWPYDKITLLDGKEYEVTKIQTGKQFQMKNSDTADYSSPNVGIITGDGTPMILSYNTKCEALDPVKNYGWSTEDNKPVSNATASCVAAVFEVNGTGKPNKQNDDVALFNANGLGNSCAVELDGGKCFGAPFAPTPVTLAECEQMKADGMVNVCEYESDYWAGVVKQCKGKGNMPTRADLGKIASAIYEGNPSIGAYDNVDNLTYKSGTATSLGLPEPDFYLWSGEESSYGVTYHRDFTPTGSHWIFSYGHRRDGSNIQAVCLVD